MAVIDISSKFLHLATSSKSFSHSIRNFVNCFSQLPDVVASLPFKLNNLFIVMAFVPSEFTTSTKASY